MNIYFLKYNNYFNRTFRRENSLIDYLAYEVGRTVDVKLFTPGDGVNTSVVVNVDLKAAGMSPDYAIVQDDQGNIESRWFVMECRQLRVNQFKVDLRRDLIVESIDSLLKCKRFWCDRGLVEDNNDLIFRPESISVNQIKTDETPIKDETKVPWIVGYLNRTVQTKEISGALDITPNKIVSNISEWEYSQYIDNWFNGYTADDANWFALYWCQDKGGPAALMLRNVYSWDIHPDQLTYNGFLYTTAFDKPVGYTRSGGAAGPSTAEVKSAFSTNTWIQQIRDRFNIKSAADTKALTLLDDKYIIQVGNTFYKVHLVSDAAVYEETINNTEATELPVIDNICKNTLNGIIVPNSPTYNLYTIHSSGIKYKIQLETLTVKKGFKYTIPTDRPVLTDAPYDMFCMPYDVFNNLGSKDLYIKAAVAAMATFNVGASAELYDVQLLPFAPELSTTTTDIKDISDNVIGKIYWATKSSFSKTILLDKSIGVENKKIDHICNKYRLVSPNYSGQFEFTAAANNGISGFKVDCTYLPLNPYIRVAPLFGGLYGREFGDARGLICGGDFSLPVVNSAWVSYQQNNKTYQATFDRSIANLEFTNDIGRQMDRLGAFVGTFQGAASGGATGATFGPWGAAIGAGVGAAGSLAGGIADINLNEQMRQEQMSYIKDQQRLNLAAIQAQPYSLSKTTAFTANNKIFPILEFYTCSKKEKEAVVSYLVNNSFNIGSIIDFKSILITSWSANNKAARKWIQGHPIEIDTGEDYHYSAELGRELAQGYYFEYWEET